MKYKYRSTCRFPVLLEISNELIQVRPNQIIESDTELKYSMLKKIVSEPVKPRRTRKKKEDLDGRGSIS